MKKEVVEKYSKQYGVRFYTGEKKKFLNAISEDFEALGYKTQIDSTRVKLSKLNQLYVGSPKSAKLVVVVPYNTPAKVFWPKNDYYPQDGYLNMKKMFLPTYIPVFIGYGILMLLIYLLPTLFPQIPFSFLSPLVLVYLIAYVMFMLKGFKNKHNASNNNSVLCALGLAGELERVKRKEVLFIFSDGHKVNKAPGNKLIAKYLETNKKKSLPILSLFCLGQGDKIQLLFDKSVKGQAKDFAKKYKGTPPLSIKQVDDSDKFNTVLVDLDHAMMLSSGVQDQDNLKVEHVATSKDDACDQELLDNVVQALKVYCLNK